jgi:sulfite reductase (NADPH) flavoprotein alpha-component
MSSQHGVTYADILLEYKSARPPLAALLSMVPQIKGRAYSITSSPNVTPNAIELCILMDTWWCDEGMRHGLTCDMLRKLQIGDAIQCRVKPGSMEPPSHDQPGMYHDLSILLLIIMLVDYCTLLFIVVCVGIGSGLAPHLSFLRDRVYAAENGTEVAPFSLYFGNRFEKREFLYKEELEGILANHGSWFKLHTAFSRDTVGKKVYVQDLVAVQDDAYVNLVKNSGMLYVCGNRNLPKPLMKSLEKSFAEGLKATATDEQQAVQEASKAVEDLYVHGSAQQEVW